MSPRTDDRIHSREIPTVLLLRVAIVASLIVALVSADTFRATEARRFVFSSAQEVIRNQFPQMVAAKLTIRQGLDEFVGREPQTITAHAISLIALGILISYIVGPVLLFTSFRRWLLGDRAPLFRVTTLVGILFTEAWIAIALPSPFVGWVIRSSARTGHSVLFSKDEIVNVMGELKIAADVYRIIPHPKGGGGSYKGFQIPERLQKTRFAEFSAEAELDHIRFHARSTVNVGTRFMDGPSTPVPDATVSVTLRSNGRFENWNYTGLFHN